jgi:hypothetical protein
MRYLVTLAIDLIVAACCHQQHKLSWTQAVPVMRDKANSNRLTLIIQHLLLHRVKYDLRIR